MFGFGSREAVLRALACRSGRCPGLRARRPRAEELADALAGALAATATVVASDDVVVEAGDERAAWAVDVAAYAHGWEVVATGSGDTVDLRPSPSLT